MDGYRRATGAVCLFFFLCSGTLAPKKQQQPVSRDGAVRIAYRNREDLQSFIYAQRASKNSERAALAGYLPQIQIVGHYSKASPELLLTSQKTPQICPETTSNTDMTFQVSQLVFSGGGPVLDYRIAREGTSIIRSQKKELKNSIRFNTESAFLDTQKELLKENFTETRDISSKIIFAQRSGQRAVGQTRRSVWLAASAQYAEQQSEVENYKYDVGRAIATLRRETNSPISPPDINLSLDGILAIQLESLNHYLMLAMKNRPDLKTQTHFIKQSRWTEKKYRRSYVPTVGLYARAAERSLGNKEVNRYAHWFAGLEFGWSFDGLGSAHAAQQYKNQTTQYILQKRDLELTIQQEVADAFLQTKSLMNKVKAAQFNLTKTESRLRSGRQRYQVGDISRANLAQREFDYEDAKFSLDALKIDTRTAYQQLLFICGYPKEKHLHVG